MVLLSDLPFEKTTLAAVWRGEVEWMLKDLVKAVEPLHVR